ncbi:hypothetical protein [Hymenobacter actinosclerus]|uniref:Uncharacterized protein n=1 Tax=Hymenobacter actinosclerus TaxID=82805 RepID=A0A1I0I4R5_9BACT|nr:hypothetical protein [Hymenobacter actinosclerus]SET90721.1 hypothetical protein SAMN04487998_3101 [Hymenobacter actinosclerus]
MRFIQSAPDQFPLLLPRTGRRPQLRQFLGALALVDGLGLGAHGAVGQVKKATPATPLTTAAPKNGSTTADQIFEEVE